MAMRMVRITAAALWGSRLAPPTLSGSRFSAPKAAALSWRGFALLLGFAVYACFTAAILPTIFKDRIELFPLDIDAIMELEPTTSNFNQSAYLLVNVGASLALFAYLNRKPAAEAREFLLKALLASGAVFFFSGLVDYTGVAPDFVASFKTAKYRVFLETEVVHVRRITGFFSEAAAYGAPCVHLGALLFFTRTAFASSLMRNWITPAVSCAMIALGALSTSSTAYIGIFMFGCLVAGRMGYRMFQGQPVSDLRVELAIAGFLILVLAVVGFVDPDLLATPLNVLDNMVLRKATSVSYIHRDLWNHFATRAFKQSYGLGVGAGAVRSSDWAISVLSNTGVIGFALMAGFIGLLFWSPPSTSGGRGPAMAIGAKFALGVFLTTQIASGTTVDPGLMLAIIAAMVVAGSKWADELTPKKRRSEDKSRSRRRRRRSGVVKPQAPEVQDQPKRTRRRKERSAS
jgi:hypothetical protein